MKAGHELLSFEEAEVIVRRQEKMKGTVGLAFRMYFDWFDMVLVDYERLKAGLTTDARDLLIDKTLRIEILERQLAHANFKIKRARTELLD